MSCGPFHTAAITDNGLLWTWGNGLFGKLGHGSHESAYRPRRWALSPVMCALLAWPNKDVRPNFTPNVDACGAIITVVRNSTTALRVEALEPCYVTCVSCGYWHTAAVAAPRSGKDSRYA